MNYFLAGVWVVAAGINVATSNWSAVFACVGAASLSFELALEKEKLNS